MTCVQEQVSINSTQYLLDIIELISSKFNVHQERINEPLARETWQQLTDKGILLSMIPKEYNGRDNHDELCEIINGIARYNLPLSMYTMIITTLFIRNVTKYGCDQLKIEVLPIFSKNAVIGGFALTEPSCGSNLAKMQTYYEETDEGYKIIGEKHWQAFSGSADWWLIAAKNIHNAKEFGYFILKRSEGWELIESYNALGLKAIDYGRSKIKALVPKHRKLNINLPKLDGAVDMLCASRLSMCAMANGFISRIYKETLNKTTSRTLGHQTLHDLDYVQFMMKKMKAGEIVSQAMYYYLKNDIDFRDDLNAHFFEAQAIKTLATDKMLESALIYQQLCGGEGYRYNASNNTAAFALLDARVYTIFDGTNDLLNQQLTEYCVRDAGSLDLLSLLKKYHKTNKGINLVINDLKLINTQVNHTQKVLIGQIIARLFGFQCLEMYRHKFTIEEYELTIQFLNIDIEKILVDLKNY